jgi:hypothetical protein
MRRLGLPLVLLELAVRLMPVGWPVLMLVLVLMPVLRPSFHRCLTASSSSSSCVIATAMVMAVVVVVVMVSSMLDPPLRLHTHIPAAAAAHSPSLSRLLVGILCLGLVLLLVPDTPAPE